MANDQFAYVDVIFGYENLHVLDSASVCGRGLGASHGRCSDAQRTTNVVDDGAPGFMGCRTTLLRAVELREDFLGGAE
jgi:hypothetical protein